ncbi:lytic murein transglycosylase B [Orrella sp. JC864]|uniref:lytic murein transglycosylase B n=1 Tax=Orrella sp. JC864 TaxID=3120298 RepID=UPI00300BDD9C
MFISLRFLQMAGMGLILAGCASTAPPARSAGEFPPPDTQAPVRPAPPPDAGAPAAPKVAEHRPGQAAQPAGAAETEMRVRAYAGELARQRGLDEQRVQAVLDTARYNASVVRLMAPPRPAADGSKPLRSWQGYRQRFVDPIRIRGGVRFMQDNAALLARAEQRYGVPAAIITAIIGVETVYGRYMGSFRSLDALATLAFDYPDPSREDRIKLFRDQLADLVELALAGEVDPHVQGSHAGAIGLPQFMPGSIKRYAVDGDGDGRIDLVNSTADAIMSVANFLIEHGWQPGLPVFAPVQLPPQAGALVDGGITPTRDWQNLAAAGARSRQDGRQPWQDAPLGVVDLADEPTGTVQYRTGTPNFFALTHYNRSYFYASSVADLAEALLQAEAALAQRPAGAAGPAQAGSNTPVER